MSNQFDRRGFMKSGAAAAAAWAAAGRPSFAAEASQAKAQPMERVRVGLVGVGSRGTWLLSLLLGVEGVEVRAVCDIIPERVAKAQEKVAAAGQAKPNGYSRGETDFQRLCETEALDLVVNATRPWKWHVPISVAAMQAGKHAATEVPAAETIEGCWQLVETAEKTQKYCVMLENCCYFREVMLVHNMLRKGLFGELRHCEAGYQHYGARARPAAAARPREDKVRTANSYPTHPIGPVAQWMDINRGNRFDYLVSMSADATGGNRNADINTSLIRTARGQTITLYFDTKLPRPYDLIYRVQGTRGIAMATTDRIYIEGRSPKSDTWEPMEAYYKEFEHPLWKELGEKAKSGGGHGGGDWLEIHRLIQALRTGAAPDMDVYDAATWSCITELSEKSVADRSRSMDFPDFTRGRWETAPPLGIIGAE
ncbi:MAG: Gfo/Idh/MocA family protein [Thermoguttaceae bacterium]|jgi:predicted dehydrogenase